MFFGSKFKYHKKLESRFWDSNCHMRPDVRAALLAFMDYFFQEIRRLNIPFEKSDIRDIFVHGSITDYYYNGQSDVDVCVHCDFSRISRIFPGVDIAKMLKNVVKSMVVDMQPRICGRMVDIVFADPVQLRKVDGIHRGSGNMYSVVTDKWIRMSPRLDNSTIKQICKQGTKLAIDMAVDIKQLIKGAKTSKEIKQYIAHQSSVRTHDLNSNYEQPLTPMVVAFRMVRNMGLLDLAYKRMLKLQANEQTGK